MANTKNLDKDARRKAKRIMRKKYKQVYGDLSLKDRKKLRKYEDGGGLKQFLSVMEKEKKEAAAAADAKAGE